MVTFSTTHILREYKSVIVFKIYVIPSLIVICRGLPLYKWQNHAITEKNEMLRIFLATIDC